MGQGAEGGANLINAARPDFNGLGGFIEGTVGTYSQRKIAGALNLRVSEKVAARLAYISETRYSFYTNVAGRQVAGGAGEQWVSGDQQDQNVRLTALAARSARLPRRIGADVATMSAGKRPARACERRPRESPWSSKTVKARSV